MFCWSYRNSEPCQPKVIWPSILDFACRGFCLVKLIWEWHDDIFCGSDTFTAFPRHPLTPSSGWTGGAEGWFHSQWGIAFVWSLNKCIILYICYTIQANSVRQFAIAWCFVERLEKVNHVNPKLYDLAFWVSLWKGFALSSWYGRGMMTSFAAPTLSQHFRDTLWLHLRGEPVVQRADSTASEVSHLSDRWIRCIILYTCYTYTCK